MDDLPGAKSLLAANSDSDTPMSDQFNAGIQPGDIEDLWEEGAIHLKSLKMTSNFIKDIHNAMLDDLSLGLSDEAINWL